MTPPLSRQRKPGCLSNLDLDEWMAGDLKGTAREAQTRDHLSSCPACSARLASFDAVDLPPVSASLREESTRALAERARRNRRRAFGTFALVGCAAAGILILRPAHPTSGERTKGGLALTVFVKRPGNVVDTVQGEGRLQAGDEMRFSLTTAAAGHAVVLGLDAAPSVTVYVPPAATAVPIAAAGLSALPGSIVADETAGAERIFAVLCPTPRDPQTLRDSATAALARAGGHPQAVTSLQTGCLETSVLFHKEPRAR